MFDHVTLRVPDLAGATSAFGAVLDQLEIEQTTSTPSFSVWGNFALTQTDEQHPITRRVHIAFIAPTRAHVDRFAQAGINAGFADDGPAGPRPKYAEDYYAASVKDHAGNGFEAVHREGQRPSGNIDHIVVRVSDVEASTAFYSDDRRRGGPHGPSPDRRPRGILRRRIRRLPLPGRRRADPQPPCRLLRRRQQRTPVPRRRSRVRISKQRRTGGAAPLPRRLLRRVRARPRRQQHRSRQPPPPERGLAERCSTTKEQRCQRSPNTISKDNGRW